LLQVCHELLEIRIAAHRLQVLIARKPWVIGMSFGNPGENGKSKNGLVFQGPSFRQPKLKIERVLNQRRMLDLPKQILCLVVLSPMAVDPRLNEVDRGAFRASHSR